MLFCEGKQYKTIKFSYNGRKEEYKICENTPVICNDNMKDRGMFNLEQFTIKSINTEGVTKLSNILHR